jgi:hypothetical protein
VVAGGGILAVAGCPAGTPEVVRYLLDEGNSCDRSPPRWARVSLRPSAVGRLDSAMVVERPSRTSVSLTRSA